MQHHNILDEVSRLDDPRHSFWAVGGGSTSASLRVHPKKWIALWVILVYNIRDKKWMLLLTTGLLLLLLYSLLRNTNPALHSLQNSVASRLIITNTAYAVVVMLALMTVLTSSVTLEFTVISHLCVIIATIIICIINLVVYDDWFHYGIINCRFFLYFRLVSFWWGCPPPYGGSGLILYNILRPFLPTVYFDGGGVREIWSLLVFEFPLFHHRISIWIPTLSSPY